MSVGIAVLVFGSEVISKLLLLYILCEADQSVS
jgi:hypothetical protein